MIFHRYDTRGLWEVPEWTGAAVLLISECQLRPKSCRSPSFRNTLHSQETIISAQRSGTVRGVHHEYTVPSLLSARLRKTQNSTVGKTWMLFPTCPPWCGARSRLYEVYNEYISIRFSTCSHIVLCMPGLCPVWHQHFSITTLKCEIKGFTGLWFWLWTIWLLFLERLIQF